MKTHHVFQRLLLLSCFVLLLSAFANAQSVKLVWLGNGNESVQKAHETLAAEYMKLNPHVEIEYIHKTPEVPAAPVMLASGTQLDLFETSFWSIASMAETGALLDLSTYYERSGKMEDFFPPAIEALRHGNGIYGIPREGGAPSILYNKNALDEIGISVPGYDWTYTDMLDIGKRGVQTASDGTVNRWGILGMTSIWPSVVWSFGGEVVSPDHTSIELTSSESIEGLEFLERFILEGVEPAPGTGGPGLAPGFQNGQTVMTRLNRSFWFTMSEVPFEWGMLTLPHGPAGSIGQLAGNAVAVAKESKHPEEAFKFATWAFGEEGWRIRLSMVQQAGVPLNRRAAQLDEFLDNGSPFLSREDNLQIGAALGQGHYLPVTTWWNDVNAAMNQEITKVWRGETSVRSAVEEAARRASALLP